MADKKNWKQISEESLVRAVDVLKESPQLAQGWYVVAALAQIAESYAPKAPLTDSEPEPVLSPEQDLLGLDTYAINISEPREAEPNPSDYDD
jgi:hypothetical protein